MQDFCMLLFRNYIGSPSCVLIGDSGEERVCEGEFHVFIAHVGKAE